MLKSNLKVMGVGLLLLFVTIGSSGAFAGKEQDKEEYEDTLVLAFAREPQSLDVQVINWSTPVHPLISEPPIRIGPDGGVVPSLLEEVRMENDGKIWIYKLPPDAKFSDETPLTAQHLKESILRYLEVSPYDSDWSMMEGYPDNPGIEVVDETTLKLFWTEYPAYTIVAVTSTYAGIVNTKIARDVGDAAFGRNPATVGPFKLEKWERGQKIVLTRNDNYHTKNPALENQGPAYVKNITIRYIPEDLTRVSELEAGNVDLMYPVPTASLKSLQQNKNLSIYTAIVPGLTRLGFNCSKPPFDDPKVRNAIGFAINKEEIADYLNNMVIPRYGFLSSAQLAYSEETEKWAKENYGYDPAKAAALLKEAGYAEGDIEAELLIPSNDPLPRKIGVVLQNQLSKVGIKVSLTENPSDYIREKAIGGEHEMALMNFSWSDPTILRWVFDPESENQYSHWRTEEAYKMLDLLLKARKVADMEKRTEMYSEIQKILLKNRPAVPIFTRKDYYAYSTRIQNLKYDPIPEGRFLWNDVKVLKKD